MVAYQNTRYQDAVNLCLSLDFDSKVGVKMQGRKKETAS